MASWKSAQSKKNKNKQVKLAIVGLGLVIGLVLLSQAFKFCQVISNPWTSDSQRQVRWSEDATINLVLRGETISLLSYNPTDGKISIINIPNQTYLEVPKGFGKWQISSITGLGGDQLLKESVTNFFGIPVEGYITADFKKLNDENIFSIFNLLSEVKTDLTPIELFKLKMGIASVRFDKISEVNLEDTGLLDKFSLNDGTPVLVSDPLRLDTLSSELADPKIKMEHKTVAIFNSTSYPGIAQIAARIISNLGADVIIVSNSPDLLSKTKILGEDSKTTSYLKQIFNTSATIEPEESLPASRAQITVYLGEDFYQSL